MRPLDETARLLNDTLLRMPRASGFRASWSWPVLAAAGGALLTLVATSASQVPAESRVNPVTVAAVSPGNCEEQTWPYLSDDCLQRTSVASGRPAKPVRVIQHDAEMANAAIGATEWTRRATPWPSQSPPHHKQKNPKQKVQETERARTVTIRSGRDQAPRVYVVPSQDAYQAYGYAPR